MDLGHQMTFYSLEKKESIFHLTLEIFILFLKEIISHYHHLKIL